MTDIQYWDDTLTDEIESISAILHSVPNIRNDMEKKAALDRAEKSLRSAQGSKRSYKMESRLVPDPNQRRQYENRLAEHEQTLASLTSDLKALKSGTQRGELFVGADTGNSDPDQTGDALLNEAHGLQDKTQASLDNTKQMVAASKEVGMATIEELERQRQTIQNIDDEAMRIEDNLQRADKLIKTFGKRMATDKLIQCFSCINVLLLVGVVVYSIVKKGGLTSDPEREEPASPVRMLMGMLRGHSPHEESAGN
eukprot:CAMPEP_0185733740 /NCGR_PEP_ID=MMETSP1171-20130828/20387_1 /TAXON_ID=374046 /ORGANISM="Helicotheca tamensis, Strain CCMP826" /LENGTH=253 /DNA_ID=CAMNT_0028403543 /DNA_START=87 /DNA_END=848 /DNA_ORIENTATION=-